MAARSGRNRIGVTAVASLALSIFLIAPASAHPGHPAGGGEADLVAWVRESVDPVQAHHTLLLTVKVRNDGPDAASEISLEVTYSLTFRLQSMTCGIFTQCRNNLGDHLFVLHYDFPAGSVTRVWFRVIPRQPGDYVTTAKVSSDTFDPDRSNTIWTETTSVT
jgi:hypothetical protein